MRFGGVEVIEFQVRRGRRRRRRGTVARQIKELKRDKAQYLRNVGVPEKVRGQFSRSERYLQRIMKGEGLSEGHIAVMDNAVRRASQRDRANSAHYEEMAQLLERLRTPAVQAGASATDIGAAQMRQLDPTTLERLLETLEFGIVLS